MGWRDQFRGPHSWISRIVIGPSADLSKPSLIGAGWMTPRKRRGRPSLTACIGRLDSTAAAARLALVKSRQIAWLALVAFVVGCTGGSDAMRELLTDADPAGGFWAIRASCDSGRLDVEFRPGERLSVPGIGHASNEEIAVECGDPERVAVSNEELRSLTPNGAELVSPSFEPVELSCVADESLLVEAHPVWSTEGVVGGALRIESGGRTILDGAISRKAYAYLPSQLRWWPARCRPE
jgi:hypothetical protein